MISPTEKGIRVDPEGDGNYGAPRGSRVHNGIDFLCDKEQLILAPFDLVIIRLAKPKAHSKLSGIAWESGSSRGKLFYFEPFISTIGKQVAKGDIIGVAQSVSEDYNLPDMKDHIHFQVDK